MEQTQTEVRVDAKLGGRMNDEAIQANCLKAFADALASAGVAHAVLSPGSRSAPLIIALGQHQKLQAHSVIDERSAAFLALGMGKADGLPAIVACTSGTAAANLAPAVHEAREAGTPLVAITADRPPELRAAGENQTIDQVGVFGSAAKQLDPPPFDAGTPGLWAEFVQTVVEASLRPSPGPVHVNMPLWDPLAAGADANPIDAKVDRVPAVTSQPVPTAEIDAGCLVVVAGRDEYGFDDGLAETADALGIPVLADPLSPAANWKSANVIENWDSILRVGSWAESHRPDVILRTGDLPTSKPLREWIKACSQSGTRVVHFDPLDSRRDPILANTAHHAFPITPSLRGAPQGDAAWLGEWVAADARASAAKRQAIDTFSLISEPAVCEALTVAMTSAEVLFISASMPVRDLESFGHLKNGPRSFANRGANGIDGTIATAAGHAIASGQPTSLVLGDVSFAHDVSSLASLRKVTTPFLTLVINNGGGAIFDGLPIAGQKDVYDEFVFTDPKLNIAAACSAWGLSHRVIATADDVGEAWRQAQGQTSPLIAEVVVAREASPQARESIRAAVAAALA